MSRSTRWSPTSTQRREHVHVCTYIWLADHNGLKVKDACIRAAERGVEGPPPRRRSRFAPAYPLVPLAAKCAIAGCRGARRACPSGNPLWTLIRGRVDLRNHRKLLVIDNRIAWCGSQNFADPEFRIKPHYAPWVDIMTPLGRPGRAHCQFLFVSDWIAEGGDDISDLLTERRRCQPERCESSAQVIGTGPTAELRCDARLLFGADPFARARSW